MKNANQLKTSHQGIALIKYYEGFSAKAYKCMGGYLTVGYGHKLNREEQINNITYYQANKILLNDILKIERVVDRNVNVLLTDNQFSALVNLTFNIGPASFQRSTLRQKINFEQWDDVEGEFNRWIYVKANIVQGLKNRRIAEYKLFNS